MKKTLAVVFLLSCAGVVRADVVSRGPYLQSGSSTTITVRWRTDVSSTGRVQVGTSTSTLTTTFNEGSSGTEHAVAVTGRTPNTTYYYSVGTSTDGVLAGGTTDYFFVTAPAAGAAKATRIWVLGDAGVASRGGINPANQNAVRDAYYNHTGTRHTDLWLFLGDNAYESGTDGEYGTNVFNVYQSMLRKSVLWPTPGNHDYGSSGGNYGNTASAAAYLSIFNLPTAGEAGGTASGTEAYYSFDYGDIHFVSLDSHRSLAYDANMLTWLSNDLAATSRTWKIVYCHHPPYTKGSHDSDRTNDSCTSSGVNCRMAMMRQQVLPILEQYGVDLLLTGHSHSYERSFLLNGHYGNSSSFTDAMKVEDHGGGPASPYTKYTGGSSPNEGTVYVVNGTGGQASGGTLNHVAMYLSLNQLGSLILDVDGNRLDATFLGTGSGNFLDRFSIVKAAGGRPVSQYATLASMRVYPNPFRPSAATPELLFDRVPTDASVTLYDVSGKKTASLPSNGTSERRWNGRRDEGGEAAPGLYMAVVESGEGKTVRKVMLIR